MVREIRQFGFELFLPFSEHFCAIKERDKFKETGNLIFFHDQNPRSPKIIKRIGFHQRLLF